MVMFRYYDQRLILLIDMDDICLLANFIEKKYDMKSTDEDDVAICVRQMFLSVFNSVSIAELFLLHFYGVFVLVVRWIS